MTDCDRFVVNDMNKCQQCTLQDFHLGLLYLRMRGFDSHACGLLFRDFRTTDLVIFTSYKDIALLFL